MPSPEARRYAEMLRRAPKMVEMDLADQRAASQHAEALTAAPHDITYQPIVQGTIQGLWAVPRIAAAPRAVLYLFGGGHVISSVQSRRKFAGHLANAIGCRVLIADYRRLGTRAVGAAAEVTLMLYLWERRTDAYVAGGVRRAAFAGEGCGRR